MTADRIQGRIVKGISGFYYVYVVGSGLYECKAKGSFRNQGVKPLVGDDVVISLVDAKKMLGNVEEILPRRNQLIRPAVSNVDQALIIFAVTQPEPNLNLLDRFLCMMDYQDVPVVICFNKTDLAEDDQAKKLKDIYESIGYRVILSCTKTGEGIEEIRQALKGHTTTVAGPSGVGKSSITNLMQSEVQMETGEISEKILRGKNTTRHSQLLYVDEDTYLLDTPGFSSMFTPEIEAENLRYYFLEFEKYQQDCRFLGCLHMNEPDCGVKKAVEEGRIHPSRYENYKLMYDEIKGKKRY